MSFQKPVEIAVENALKTNYAVGIGSTNAVVERNNSVGNPMKKSVTGLHLVHVTRNLRRSEVREGTTGRPIPVPRSMVPRIMAVAEPLPKSAEPVSAGTREIQPVRPEPKAELAFYRKYTEAMLHRYARISTQPGRTPSLLGRELFRGDASHSTMTTFEDGVIFCLDVERCLARLRPLDRKLIRRIALQGHTAQEAAPLLGISFRACYVFYYEALDRLTEIFVATRLLEPSKCGENL